MTVAKASLTVAANPASMTFGSSVPSFTSMITGFVNNETPSVVSGHATLSTTATSSSPVGSYPITVNVSGLSAANYTFAPKTAR